MEGTWSDGRVVVGGTARQQFYDSRGYGEPLSGNTIALSPTEAAYLLSRGDLGSVDGEGFPSFFSFVSDHVENAVARFLTYCDLRERGYYLSPDEGTGELDFVVFERGSSPHDGSVAYEVMVVGERDSISLDDLGGVVLSVVDGEGEVSYFQTSGFSVANTESVEGIECEGVLLSDRVVVWDAPEALHSRYFFGQPFPRNASVLGVQLSLVEAAFLVDAGLLQLGEDSWSEVMAHGRSLEGSRFDRRVAVYSELREHGYTPKTGLKFGADFRVYEEVGSVEDLGHSEYLVQVVPRGYEATAQELALEVRLAHGVRKRTIFAVTDGRDVVNWLAVSRLTP